MHLHTVRLRPERIPHCSNFRSHMGATAVQAKNSDAVPFDKPSVFSSVLLHPVYRRQQRRGTTGDRRNLRPSGACPEAQGRTKIPLSHVCSSHNDTAVHASSSTRCNAWNLVYLRASGSWATLCSPISSLCNERLDVEHRVLRAHYAVVST